MPVTKVLPSGANDTDHTRPSKPLITCRKDPVSTSHNSTRPARYVPRAIASVLPSGENRVEYTRSVVYVKTRGGRRGCACSQGPVLSRRQTKRAGAYRTLIDETRFIIVTCIREDQV